MECDGHWHTLHHRQIKNPPSGWGDGWLSGYLLQRHRVQGPEPTLIKYLKKIKIVRHRVLCSCNPSAGEAGPHWLWYAQLTWPVPSQ